ncbi:calcium and integrin-binding protein 1-like [Anticarsia gemmatalis]|uniref:calcium and integrin-binding protein 1-like n=1 Tax=Anticarsia gemmatalis TaxID=129554 RepID=UPI003F763C21
MGCQQSYPGLTEDIIEDYASLTYLNKGEILHLMKKFYSIDPEKIQNNYHHRFNKEEITNRFPVIKNNPFQDRIFSVFSSMNDDCFSFEDLLDLCSAMSSECPPEVKAAWAFKIFDLDGDNQITAKDISQIVDRLTWNPYQRDHYIDRESKMKISKVILQEINLDNSGSIGLNEFKLIMSRIPEFASSFYFRL